MPRAIGDHNCWTVWGPQRIIDSPERLRRYTRIRRQVGERPYRALRYHMAIAQTSLDLHRLICEMYR